MSIFHSVYVVFYWYAVCIIWRKTLSSFVAQKTLFGKIPSVLKGPLGMGVFRYRIFQQSVAVTMKVIVE